MRGPILLTTLLLLAPPNRAAAGPPAGVEEQRGFRVAVESVRDALVQLRHVGAEGSGGAAMLTTGVVVAEGGWIVTSGYRLAADPAATIARFSDGTRSPAWLVARDRNRGLVLFQAAEAPRSIASLKAAENAQPGQWAIAIGRGMPGDSPVLSVGVVSGVGRLSRRAIQTDAAVSAVNYGGPLVDSGGAVLGLLTPLAPRGQDGAEWYDAGVGFAVPLSDLLPRLARLQAGEDLHPGRLGVRFPPGDPFRDDPVIAEVVADSPAAEAGIRAGDRLIAVDVAAVTNVYHARSLLRGRDAGATLRLVIERENAQLSLAVRLAESIDALAPD